MARRKITDAIDAADIAELPELTANQQEFVRLLCEGHTASDAYRGAYDCSNMSKPAIWVEASRLRNHPHVALWLSAARKAHLGTATVTIADHMRELERLKEIAVDTGNVGAAVQAEQLRGKAAGHYVEQVRDVTSYDPVQTLREIAQEDPEYAATLAAKHGIEWTADQGSTKH